MIYYIVGYTGARDQKFKTIKDKVELTYEGKLYVSKCFRHYCPVVVEASHWKKTHVSD